MKTCSSLSLLFCHWLEHPWALNGHIFLMQIESWWFTLPLLKSSRNRELRTFLWLITNKQQWIKDLERSWTPVQVYEESCASVSTQKWKIEANRKKCSHIIHQCLRTFFYFPCIVWTRMEWNWNRNMEIKALTFILIFSIMDIIWIINKTCLQL